jgi:hypothetical protein
VQRSKRIRVFNITNSENNQSFNSDEVY